MNKNYNSELSIADPINRELIKNQNDLSHQEYLEKQTMMADSFSFKNLSPLEYIHATSNFLSESIISKYNLKRIKKLAQLFNKGTTSFFGFETRLGSNDANSDYLFAISSKNGEREILADQVNNHKLPENILEKAEWIRISNFTNKWIDEKSNLYNNVLGIWFEFDTSKNSKNIPGVFIHTVPLTSRQSEKDIKWLINNAIPILKGKNLNVQVRKNISNCIKKLPQKSAIYQVGTMLQRDNTGVRLVIKRINTNEIISYLRNIGWKGDIKKLSYILNEIEKFVNRIVLHINVSNEIDKKIGIECSFYKEEDKMLNWKKFFNFLKEKDLCITEKIDSLIEFPGMKYEKNDLIEEINEPITKMTSEESNNALLRFISHIKIVYDTNDIKEAKAYYGVKLIASKKNFN